MSIDSPIMQGWVIPVLTNVIAVVLLALLRPAGRLISMLARRGKVTVQSRWQTLSRMKIIATLKYSFFVGISLISIPLNCYFIWLKARIPGSPTRMEVIELIAMCAIALYWLVDFVYKIKNYDVADYLQDDD